MHFPRRASRAGSIPKKRSSGLFSQNWFSPIRFPDQYFETFQSIQIYLTQTQFFRKCLRQSKLFPAIKMFPQSNTRFSIWELSPSLVFRLSRAGSTSLKILPLGEPITRFFPGRPSAGRKGDKTIRVNAIRAQKSKSGFQIPPSEGAKTIRVNTIRAVHYSGGGFIFHFMSF